LRKQRNHTHNIITFVYGNVANAQVGL
jgi:hypothetical protein